MFSRTLRETMVSSLMLSDPNLARQNPADYLLGIEATIRGAIQKGKESDPQFHPRTSSALELTQREAVRCRWMQRGRLCVSSKDSKTIPRQWCGFGKITPAIGRPRKLRSWHPKYARSTSRKSAARIRRNGGGARSCTAKMWQRMYSKPLPAGLKSATGFLPS